MFSGSSAAGNALTEGRKGHFMSRPQGSSVATPDAFEVRLQTHRRTVVIERLVESPEDLLPPPSRTHPFRHS